MPVEHDGVRKFLLDFTRTKPVVNSRLTELSAWRQLLFKLKLIGRDPARYDGLAYGNISRRANGQGFLVSGGGTGDKEWLNPEDYCEVIAFDLLENRVQARGPSTPSSESLTHGAVYASNPAVDGVIHVHSPEIWKNAQRLGMCHTDKSFAYGTPAMASAIAAMARFSNAGIIAMGGHQDGIIAYADNIKQAVWQLLEALTMAWEIERS